MASDVATCKKNVLFLRPDKEGASMTSQSNPLDTCLLIVPVLNPKLCINYSISMQNAFIV